MPKSNSTLFSPTARAKVHTELRANENFLSQILWRLKEVPYHISDLMDKIKCFLIIGNNSSEKSWNSPTNFSLEKKTDIFKILYLDKVQSKLKQCLVMGSAATSLIGVAPWAAAGFSHNCLKQTKANKPEFTVATET